MKLTTNIDVILDSMSTIEYTIERLALKRSAESPMTPDSEDVTIHAGEKVNYSKGCYVRGVKFMQGDKLLAMTHEPLDWRAVERLASALECYNKDAREYNKALAA